MPNTPESTEDRPIPRQGTGAVRRVYIPNPRRVFVGGGLFLGLKMSNVIGASVAICPAVSQRRNVRLYRLPSPGYVAIADDGCLQLLVRRREFGNRAAMRILVIFPQVSPIPRDLLVIRGDLRATPVAEFTKFAGGARLPLQTLPIAVRLGRHPLLLRRPCAAAISGVSMEAKTRIQERPMSWLMCRILAQEA
jgi:hypothetical protein